jgi:4,5-dihydroxyphthalate decarboxylase
MAKLRVSFVSGRSDWTAALFSGEVEPQGAELIPTASDPSESFWRQLNFGVFEAGEMSLASFLIARERGVEMVAIPAFPGRRFMHTELYYHVDSGITTPASLSGKRIGVAEYQQTASLWTRGILEHDFGVSQYDLTWVMERPEELSHGGATGFSPPTGIKFERMTDGDTLDTALLAQRIDVAPALRAVGREPNLVDRATLRPRAEGDWSKLKPLFPDRMAEARRFMGAHGYVPANHLYVVRGDVHERHPWLAFNLYRALLESKEKALARVTSSLPAALVFGREYLAETREILGDDPFTYGVEANTAMLTDALDYAHEQGLIATRPEIASLFAPEVARL